MTLLHFIPNVNVQSATEKITLLRRSPRIFLIEDFLSDGECEHLKSSASTRLERSRVVSKTGEDYIDDVRTCMNAWLRNDHVIETIEDRIEALTGVPKGCGETLTILNYQVGQEFKPHHDYYETDNPGYKYLLAQQGQRIATILMYLSDVEEGGDTVFPRLNLRVKPRKRSLLFFANVDRKNNPDPFSLHAGEPILRGEKWVATKWLCEKNSPINQEQEAE